VKQIIVPKTKGISELPEKIGLSQYLSVIENQKSIISGISCLKNLSPSLTS
jgi:hypothetical protein